MTVVDYSARCPIPSCRKHLGTWTVMSAAISRVLEHLFAHHGITPVAVNGFHEEIR